MPTYAYPVLVATFVGWIWTLWRETDSKYHSALLAVLFDGEEHAEDLFIALQKGMSAHGT